MRWSSPALLIFAASCGSAHDLLALDNEPGASGEPLNDVEDAPPASPRLDSDVPADISSRIDTHFEGHGSQRVHVQLDRPLYRPGETVWVKTWSVVTRGLGRSPQDRITYEIVNPRGQVVETKLVQQAGGTATNDFVLGAEAPGGKWVLRATLPTGEVDERPFVVSNYQAPIIRKSLEFVREAYGPGDRVDALLELEHPAGGPLADHPVRALLQVAGETVLDGTLTTDGSGALLVSAQLSDDLRSSDGLLTILVEHGGVNESISRSVPIVLADLQLAFFPEGGDMVAGLPGRVYFEATNQHGEPADVTGYLTDDHGERVADFASVHDGLGRVAFTPERGRLYVAHVTSPVGIDDGFPLPASKKEGCSLRSFDDLRSERPEVRVAVRCSDTRDVTVAGVLRETALDTAAVSAGPDQDAVVYLRAADAPGDALADQQGAVRVTVFDSELTPLAERLVYRNPGRDLNISVRPDKKRYGPRDEVVLEVRTTDPSDRPVEAEIALSVVDDAVISLADAREGHLLSRLYLEPELVDSPKDPGWYFDDDEALAARGLDLVMGTRGWRRFEWKQVWAPEPVLSVDTSGWAGGMAEPDMMAAVEAAPRAAPMPEAAMPAPPMPAVQPEPQAKAAQAPAEDAMKKAKPVERDARRVRRRDAPAAGARAVAMDELVGLGGLGYVGDADMHFAHDRIQQQSWAAVRVFPRPDYSAGLSGTRTDFRDTVHWEPTVRTSSDGKAEVRFYLSDAVSTFRVTAEGLGGSDASDRYAGHSEETITSVLPVSVATKLPAAVSVGDRLEIPLIVSSSRDETLAVRVSGVVNSDIVKLREASGKLSIDAGETATHWISAEIGAGNQTATVALEAAGGGLTDRAERELRIVPAGFPRSWSAAGESDGDVTLAFQLDDVIDDSLTASVTWHPSTVSTLISGMEGLIRSPGGCFEQTSSTNWPNVAILAYLEAHDGDPRLRAKSSRALDVGYAKLTGYQVEAGGFETWGSGPGKEALSAFGLMQFSDMQKVYPVADDVLTRDAAYLLAQRTGKGGFERTGESAHGYGSAPAAVLDGFITYALVTTGHADGLETEVEHQAAAARTSDDPYVLALATRSLLVTDHPGAKAAVERLAALQADDGSFPGAESSITRSYEANLLVESTALAALALMEAGTHRRTADAAAGWLVDNRQGAGTWGATQATALALDALGTHAEVNKVPRSSGELFVEVNGEPMGTLAYSAEQSEPLTIDGWEGALRAGKNEIVLRHEGGEPLPFTVEVAWTAIAPMTSPGAELSLETALDNSDAEMGETVRLTATVGNRTDRVVPNPIARIGIPAGLEPQLWQLAELQERGEVALYETRTREVTLYWDGLHEGDQHTVNLDLVAAIPGEFTGPASSAYPYYNDDEKAWRAGLEVAIDRPDR